MSVLIGVDLGQRREPTAICVVEAQRRRSVYGEEQHFLVRYLERMEIGTSYPSAAQQTARIVTEVNPLGDGVSVVYVDATGLGQPVIEIFESRVQEARVTPVYLTHGDRRHIGESQEVVLGKAYLVARLQTLLQTTARNNLAQTLYAQGDLSGARQLQEQVLEARERTLGVEHPQTMIAAWNLFRTLASSGDSIAASEVLFSASAWPGCCRPIGLLLVFRFRFVGCFKR